jgi:hypothetical protein
MRYQIESCTRSARVQLGDIESVLGAILAWLSAYPEKLDRAL